MAAIFRDHQCFTCGMPGSITKTKKNDTESPASILLQNNTGPHSAVAIDINVQKIQMEYFL